MENKIGHKPHSLEFFPKYFSSLDAVIHYTCNAPEQKVLDKYGITTRGQDFGCKDSREVLQIPVKVLLKFGYSKKDLENKAVLQMNCEYLMKRLESKLNN